MKRSIHDYVQALPEVYQSVYGHGEYMPSRNCEERWLHLKRVLQSVQEKTGKKNIRVLDIGCAQGYYTLSASAMGAEAEGVDFCGENIALCSALSEETGLAVDFRCGTVDMDYVDDLGEYDVILILSVLHHVAHTNGFSYARSILEKLSQKAKLVVTELALREEPLYWSGALPPRYEDWFANIAFFDELAFFGTHLSDISRPLIVCSDNCLYLDGLILPFSLARTSAYAGKAPDPARRYFTSDKEVTKLFRKTNQNAASVDEIKTEIQFLQKNSQKLGLYRVIYSGENERRVFAVYEKICGQLLWDLIRNNAHLDVSQIAGSLLEQLVRLESAGFYHGDFRTWNVIVSPDGAAHLIDFGNISESKTDAVATQFNFAAAYTNYDAFMALLYDMLRGTSYGSIEKYGRYWLSYDFTLDGLPRRYADFFRWYLVQETNDLSYAAIREHFSAIVLHGESLFLSSEDRLRFLEHGSRRALAERVKIESFETAKIESAQQLGQLGRTVEALQSLDSEQQMQLAACEERVDGQERRIAACEERVDGQEQRIAACEERVDGQEQRIAACEECADGQAQQLTEHAAWMEERALQDIERNDRISAQETLIDKQKEMLASQRRLLLLQGRLIAGQSDRILRQQEVIRRLSEQVTQQEDVLDALSAWPLFKLHRKLAGNHAGHKRVKEYDLAIQEIQEEAAMEINIEKIMQDIRAEVEAEGPWEDIPAFEPFAQETAQSGESYPESRGYLNRNYELNYYWELGPRGLKTFVKRAIRKLLKFLLPPLLTRQTEFNARVVRCVNGLQEQMDEARKQNAALQEENRALRERLDALEKTISGERAIG